MIVGEMSVYRSRIIHLMSFEEVTMWVGFKLNLPLIGDEIHCYPGEPVSENCYEEEGG